MAWIFNNSRNGILIYVIFNETCQKPQPDKLKPFTAVWDCDIHNACITLQKPYNSAIISSSLYNWANVTLFMNFLAHNKRANDVEIDAGEANKISISKQTKNSFLYLCNRFVSGICFLHNCGVNGNLYSIFGALNYSSCSPICLLNFPAVCISIAFLLILFWWITTRIRSLMCLIMVHKMYRDAENRL